MLFYKPFVIDKHGIVPQEQKEWFLSRKFPRGFAFAVATVDGIEPVETGTRADEIFEETAKSLKAPNNFKERGILLVLSKNPELIQVRTGSDIKLFARSKGVCAGPKYIQIQQMALKGSLPDAFVIMTKHLITELPIATELSFWERVGYNKVSSAVLNEINEFGLPSDSFYSSMLLKPVLKLRVWELNTSGSWWITYLIIGILIYVLRQLVGLIFGSIMKHIKNRLLVLLSVILHIGIGIFLSIPAFSSAAILSSGRMEDIIALKASGIPYVEYLGLSADNWGVSAPLLIIAILVTMRYLKGVSGEVKFLLLAHLPAEAQLRIFMALEKKDRGSAENLKYYVTWNLFDLEMEEVSDEEFMKEPFTHIYNKKSLTHLKSAGSWGFLAMVVLSKAIVVTAIYIWSIPVLKGYYDHIVAIRKFNKANTDSPFKLYTIFLFPAFLLVLFWVLRSIFG
ncbi:MAG: hypothetical protein KAW12_22350 [Candidatus Aminicenantes bacterium]|nr:hypothetical protein [Candidatus Aminicenantes bacterium]